MRGQSCSQSFKIIMREFQERNTIKKRIYSKTTLVILLVVLGLMIHGLYSVYQKEKESRTEVERVKREQVAVEGRYNNIQKGSDDLKSEAGIEAEIRNKFDVVKPGEGVIVVVNKNPTAIETDKQGVLKKFWNSITGIFRRD